MKTVTKFIAIALAAVAAGAAGAATPDTSAAPSTGTTSAPGDGHHHFRGRGLVVGQGLLRALHQLNLTSAQQQQVRSILMTARTQWRSQMQQNAGQTASLSNPGDPNFNTAVQNAKTLAANRVQAASEVETQIYGVLTSAQQAQLPQVLAQMQQRRAAHQNGSGSNS